MATSGAVWVAIRDLFKGHIARSSSGPVYRKHLEVDLCEVLAEDRGDWLGSPTHIHLHSRDSTLSQLTLPADGLVGPARSGKVAADWQGLSAAAHEVAEFVGQCTERRTIVLDGRQCMSAACLLGHAFRATSRFALHVEHNGTLYRTDVYDQENGPFFNETLKRLEAKTAQGIVSIAFTTAM